MMPIACHRMVSKFVATSTVVGREQGATDRGWQDKSRKVRAAGRGRGDRQNPTKLQTLRIAGATCWSCHGVVVPQLSTPCASRDDA
jgi:hypothetical protein